MLPAMSLMVLTSLEASFPQVSIYQNNGDEFLLNPGGDYQLVINVSIVTSNNYDLVYNGGQYRHRVSLVEKKHSRADAQTSYQLLLY